MEANDELHYKVCKRTTCTIIDLKYNGSYVPETEVGILLTPLTDLHDPGAMKMSYSYLPHKRESVYQSVQFSISQAVF